VKFGIVSESPKLAGADIETMRVALLAGDAIFAPQWDLAPAAVEVYDSEAHVPPQVIPIVFVPSEGEADALGYHTDTARAFIRVLVDPTLEAGGQLFTGPYSLFSVAMHEWCETRADPWANTWVDGPTAPDGSQYALEVCLAGDTTVRLADGSAVAIERLAESRHGFSVRAARHDGRIVNAAAHGARLTGRHVPVVRVALSDGSSIRCTANHRLLLSDGTYAEASSLAVGDALFSDMLPPKAVLDSVDRTEVDPVAGGKGARRLRAISNSYHIRSRQLRAPMSIPAPFAVAGHSALAGRIQHVAAVGVQEQMVRPDARGVVARMTHLHVGRNAATRELERYAMRQQRFSMSPNLSVPRRRSDGARPCPASIALGHLVPEALLERGRTGVVKRLPGGQLPMPMHSAPMGGAQPFGANGTRARFNRAGHSKIVLSVTPDGISDVYDLTVPLFHNFEVQDGIFAHNCDPAEGTAIPVPLPSGVAASGENFVLPRYFDPLARAYAGVMDHAGTITEPFTLGPQGYLIVRDTAGKVWQRFGETMPPEWRRKARRRTAKRLGR